MSQSGKFSKVRVINTKNDKEVLADVLQNTDKVLKVVLDKTDITLLMTRNDVRKHYVGNLHGLEFTSNGKEI